MKKILSVALLIGATFVYAENSAFGAGDLTNNSYGLTQNEKTIKQKLDTLNNNYSEINARINEANERIEGLQSAIEGINSQYTKINSRLNQSEENYENLENNLTQEINNLKSYVEESRKIQENNNKQFKKVLAELSTLVDSINTDYVSKKEMEKNYNNINVIPQKDINTTSTIENNQSSKITPEEQKEIVYDESWKKENNNKILDLAILDLNQNKFEEMKLKLNYLLQKHYKPARVNFYFGEIEYKQKNYNNAIVFYKKSSAISTKGDYFPKLLYHTAISLDKIGDPKTANGFYKALKTNYPNSPEAKASPNRK
ncbi:hypothetical protein JG677_00235 [Campylobacter sp. TTU-622]|uniref:tetratricopeptide repeat protein n=1 Tax=unclassified Campylobacter TaxID=2593542 RepID=UPI001908A395|nr:MULTISPECIES: tetratricopeptide repeat protein [unclassified Campylobacter]MBK1971327.1 hypothetical protein [Campylobacter sp. TTU_617]MBK1972501.1 hypothetical protein [Campylobacter sp. TTU-622]